MLALLRAPPTTPVLARLRYRPLAAWNKRAHSLAAVPHCLRLAAEAMQVASCMEARAPLAASPLQRGAPLQRGGCRRAAASSRTLVCGCKVRVTAALCAKHTVPGSSYVQGHASPHRGLCLSTPSRWRVLTSPSPLPAAAPAPSRRLCVASAQPQVPNECQGSNSTESSTSASTRGTRLHTGEWVGKWLLVVGLVVGMATFVYTYHVLSQFGLAGKVLWCLMPLRAVVAWSDRSLSVGG